MPLRLPSPDNRQPLASPPLKSLTPSWSHPRPVISRGASQHYARNNTTTFRDNLLNNAEKIQRRTMQVIRKMSIWQKVLAVVAIMILGVLGVLFLTFNHQIFQMLVPVAKKWKETPGGWIILWLLTFCSAFPPLIGYSTCSTLAGFVYGVREGWIILSTATVAGSFCSFLVSRTILRSYVERLVANDKRFAALALTLKHDGLKLLCMIRLCPLPYSISNGAMSTVPTVQPAMYALATAIVTPKLFVIVFIGSRLALVADTNQQMSAGTRAINWLSIIIGVSIGVCTGWFIYKKTMARAAQLETEETPDVRDTPRRGGGHSRSYSDDPEVQGLGDSLTPENDAVDYFDDTPSPKPPFSNEFADEEDVFSQGDGTYGTYGDSIGLKGQKR